MAIKMHNLSLNSPSMKSVSEDLLSLVWNFLHSNNYKKTAKALSKEAGQDFQSNADFSLVDVYKKYLENSSSSSEESSSENSTSEEESESDSKLKPVSKDIVSKGSKGSSTKKSPSNLKSCQIKPGSSEESSSSENDSEKVPIRIGAQKTFSAGEESSSSDEQSSYESSDSESASGSDEVPLEKGVEKWKKVGISTLREQSTCSSFSSSSESESKKSDKLAGKRSLKPKVMSDKCIKLANESSSSSDQESDSQSEVSNKKTGNGGKSTPNKPSSKKHPRESSSSSSEISESSDHKGDSTSKTSSVVPPKTLKNDHPSKKLKLKDSTSVPATKSNQSKAPFSRINKDDVIFAHDSLRHNGFSAPEDSYGAKANRDLAVTRGKGFRAEKGKKKRGSYKGGKIDMESRSFKFS